MWRRFALVKKAVNVFDIIEEVNKDLGEDLIFAYEPEGDYPISAMVADKELTVGGKMTRQIGKKYETFTKIEDIEARKKRVLSMFCNVSFANPYSQLLEASKNNIAKIRNYHKVLLYLSDRYGMPFAGYANIGSQIKCYVVFPDVKCRMNPMFGFAKYFTFWFDGNKISKKSLEAYCRKMDKVAERMRCLWKAFGDNEYFFHVRPDGNAMASKNFYHLCEIKRSRSGEWLIKFPYTLTKKRDNFYGSEREMLAKLMKMFRYKDESFCIWKASNPEEFEMTRELLKCQ